MALPSSSTRGFLSSVFRKPKEPKVVKDLYTSSDNDEDDASDHVEEQQKPTEELDTPDAKIDSEEGAKAEASEEPRKKLISRNSSRSSRGTLRTSSRRQRSSRVSNAQSSANSLALKLESGARGNSEENHHEDDRSVVTSATSASRRGMRGGSGRHRLGSRNVDFNRSTDSLRGLLGKGDGQDDQPEVDLLDASSKSAPGLPRTRSRRTTERTRSRKQTLDGTTPERGTSFKERSTPSSPRKISSRRHHSSRVDRNESGILENTTKSMSNSEKPSNIGEEEDTSTKRKSDPLSRSSSRPHRSRSHHGMSRSSTRERERGRESSHGQSAANSTTERKSSSDDKPRRSRSKSITQSSRSNGTRSRSKSALNKSISTSRQRSSSRLLTSRRREESVDRKKHNAQRKAASKTLDGSEKRASTSVRKHRGSSKQPERRHRDKRKSVIDNVSPEDIGKDPVESTAVTPSGISTMENAISTPPSNDMEGSLQIDFHSSFGSAANLHNSFGKEGHSSGADSLDRSLTLENHSSKASLVGGTKMSEKKMSGSTESTDISDCHSDYQVAHSSDNPLQAGEAATPESQDFNASKNSITFDTMENNIVMESNCGIEDSANLERSNDHATGAGTRVFRKEETRDCSPDLSSTSDSLSKTEDASNSSSSEYDYIESRKFSMGEVLQFDPSQAGLVHLVKQVSSDKTGYEINGQSGQIGEIIDPVSNLQTTPRNAPLFNLLDDDPEATNQNEAPASPTGGRRRRKNRFSLRRSKSQSSDDDDDYLEGKSKDGQEKAADPRRLRKELLKEINAKSLGYNEDPPAEFLSPTQTKEKKKALFNEMFERMRSKGRSKSNGSENSGGQETYRGDSKEEPASDLLLSPTPKDRKKKLYGTLEDNDDESIEEPQTPSNTSKEKKRTLAKKASGYLHKMLNSSATNMLNSSSSNLPDVEGVEDDISMASTSTSKSGKKSLKLMFTSSSKGKRTSRGLLSDADSVAASLADEELLYDQALKAK